MKKQLLILFMILTAITAHAQQVTLYQMYSSIPQSNQVNPVFMPKSKITIGLPLISSDYVSFSAPASFDDFFTKGADDSLRIDEQKVIDAFNKSGNFDFEGNIALLFLGLRTKTGFLSLSLNSRVDAGFTLPGSLVEFAFRGSGDPGAPASIRINDINLRTSWFNELAVGYSRAINSKITVGGKLKYLQGIGTISVEGLNGYIESSMDSIHISMDSWAVHTAGEKFLNSAFPDDSVDSEFNTDYFLFKNGNKGWGVDVGVEYKLMDNLLLTASVLDVGKITWREDTKSYLFDEVKYTFEGFDLMELLEEDNNDPNSQSTIDDEIDSLENLFEPKEMEGTVFSTPLTGKFYAGGRYTLLKMHTFGVIVYGKIFKSKLTPSVALTYNLELGKILNVGVNATFRNKTFNNFGAGLSAKLGPVQVYGLVDNIQSILFAESARVISARVGLNFMFGKVKGSD